MIIRTYNQCKKAVHQSKILVATDHKKIFQLCKKKNFNTIMTSKKCLTGTDRIAEVSKKIKKKFYINVQGDEPMCNPNDIKKVINYAKNIQILLLMVLLKLKIKIHLTHHTFLKLFLNKMGT